MYVAQQTCILQTACEIVCILKIAGETQVTIVFIVRCEIYLLKVIEQTTLYSCFACMF